MSTFFLNDLIFEYFMEIESKSVHGNIYKGYYSIN